MSIGVTPDAVLPADVDESVPKGELPRQHATGVVNDPVRQHDRGRQAYEQGMVHEEGDVPAGEERLVARAGEGKHDA